jgi:hypothetical protein
VLARRRRSCFRMGIVSHVQHTALHCHSPVHLPGRRVGLLVPGGGRDPDVRSGRPLSSTPHPRLLTEDHRPRLTPLFEAERSPSRRGIPWRARGIENLQRDAGRGCCQRQRDKSVGAELVEQRSMTSACKAWATALGTYQGCATRCSSSHSPVIQPSALRTPPDARRRSMLRAVAAVMSCGPSLGAGNRHGQHRTTSECAVPCSKPYIVAQRTAS